jgi:hypothetical protein
MEIVSCGDKIQTGSKVEELVSAETSTIWVAIHDQDQSTYAHVIEPLRQQFVIRRRFEDRSEVELLPTFLCEAQHIQKKLSILLEENGPCCFIVVSDELVQKVGGKWVPSPLTEWIRSQVRKKRTQVGLIAIVPNEARRTSDIDRVLDARDLDSEELLKAIFQTAQGLSLKLPPRRDLRFSREDAVVIRLAQSKDELFKCFRLRHEVYGLMGYLDEEILASQSKIEMDSFDQMSLHFLATDIKSDSTVGTLRLVLPRPSPMLRNTIIGNPYEVYATHARWCEEIARAASEDSFRKRLSHPYMAALPIFQSFDFRQRWEKVLLPPSSYAEISRVVVSPKFRGLAVSKLLMHTAIAAAISLRMKFLLLDCIPDHVPMYAKYGFVELGGTHSRVQELDQLAVGMKLDLDETPNNLAFQLGKRTIEAIHRGPLDSKMLFGTKHLCLCARKACWENAEYKFRTLRSCPLWEQHVDTLGIEQ